MLKKLNIGIALAAALTAGAAEAAFKYGDPWPNMTIPYVLGSDLSPEAKQAFLKAVDYFRDYTQVQFIDVTNSSGGAVRNSYIEVHQTTGCTSVGVGKPTNAWVGSLIVGDPSFTIAIDPLRCPVPEAPLILHEMFHVLGFLHEQSRRDARKYLEFNDPVINANYPAPDLYNYVPFQFPSFYPQNFGPYDYDSISHYVLPDYYASRTPITPDATTITSEGQDALVTYLKETGESRYFRIVAADGTAMSSFDNNLWLNFTAPPVSPYPTAMSVAVSNITGIYRSPTTNEIIDRWKVNEAQFNFVYTGSGNQFYIKHRASNKYLIANSPTNPYGNFSLSSSKSAAGKWELVNSGDGESFKIREVGYGRFLSNYVGSAGLTSGSQTGSDWLIKIARQTTYGPATATTPRISIMDYVALHWRYGFPFRLKTKDSTADLYDNPTLHTKYYQSDLTQLHSTPGQLRIDLEPNANLDLPSSRWMLERVSTYGLNYNSSPSNWVRIKNVDNGGYLNTENNGQIQLHKKDTVNDAGKKLISPSLNDDWKSAQWELVIGSDYFLIKNRESGSYLYNNNGVMAVGSTISDAYKWYFQSIERSRHSFNLPCNWCL